MPIDAPIDQNFEEIRPSEAPPPKTAQKIEYLSFGNLKFPKKTAFLALGGFLLFFLLLAGFGAYYQISVRKNQKPLATPTPTPYVFEEKIASPSAYATDSAVLKIEENLKTLDKDIQATDLDEAGLTPPVIDRDVNFGQ